MVNPGLKPPRLDQIDQRPGRQIARRTRRIGAAAQTADRTVKGEIVVLVGRAGAIDVDDSDVVAALRDAMTTMRVKDAATLVAGAMGLPRRQVYQLALTLGAGG